MRSASIMVAAFGGFALAACASTPAPARLTEWDAVAAAPDGHRVLLENENIRVLRVSIPPGGFEPVHEHGWPSVMYFEKPQPITYIVYELVDGKPVERERIEAPALPAGHTETMGLKACTLSRTVERRSSLRCGWSSRTASAPRSSNCERRPSWFDGRPFRACSP